MIYSIGSNLDNQCLIVLNKLVEKYNMDKKNVEVFTSCPFSEFALNRSANKENEITKQDFLNHMKLIKRFGYDLNYVFNCLSLAPADTPTINNELELLKKNNIEADILTFANIELLKYVNGKYNIALSTVLNIDTMEKFDFYVNKFNEIGNKNLTLKRVILGFKLNKDIDLIKDISEKCKKLSIEVELLVDHACVVNCNHADEHYYTDQKKFTSFKCPYDINKNNFLNENGSYILPKLTDEYENMGVTHFKLSTRNSKLIAFYNVVNDYFSREFVSAFDWYPAQKNVVYIRHEKNA